MMSSLMYSIYTYIYLCFLFCFCISKLIFYNDKLNQCKRNYSKNSPLI